MPAKRPRSEEWRRERETRRAEIHNRAVQGLFILNGGGAIALISFLAQTVDKSVDWVRPIAWGLVPLIVGLLLAAPINFLRYESSRAHDSFATRDKGVLYGHVWRWLAVVSLVMFAIGASVVATGILTSPLSPAVVAKCR